MSYTNHITRTSTISRWLILIFGVNAYLLVNGTLFYLIGFVINISVPKSIDGPLHAEPPLAVFLNLFLLLIFCIPHSLLARKKIQQLVMSFLPVPARRSVFVLISVGSLIILFIFWQPMPKLLWNVETSWLRYFLYLLFCLGWMLMLWATYLIDHFELFGLRQVIQHFRGRGMEDSTFRAPSLYQHVRHPMMLGFLIGFWATPEMSYGHFLFSSVMSLYMMVGIYLEEKDLIRSFGQTYTFYKCLVPRILPSIVPFRKKTSEMDTFIDKRQDRRIRSH